MFAFAAGNFDLDPTLLESPREVSGVVVHFGSGKPISGAEVTLKWHASPVIIDRMKVLARMMSGEDGQFRATISHTPLSSVGASVGDSRYMGWTSPDGDLSEPLVVRVRPNLAIASMRWDRPREDLKRLREIALGFLANHVPGTPPPRETMRSHLEAGRISEQEIEFLLENRELFAGPLDFGTPSEPVVNPFPPPGQLRVLWLGLEMDYGGLDDEVKFLTWGEAVRRGGWSDADVRDFLDTYCTPFPDDCPWED